jgi:hypothetical protein
MFARLHRAALVGAVASVLAGCAASQGEASPSVPSPSPNPTVQPDPTSPSSPTSAPDPSVRPSAEAADPVVAAPGGILPPASIALVTADGLRVREGMPGTPEHARVIYTLNAGDLVYLASQNSASGTVFGYVGPEESPDGLGWYQVHVGGSGPMTWIDGGITGWIAEGSAGLEYLELLPVSCPADVTLETVIYRLGQTPDADEWMTAWDRLACFGGREMTLTGVWEHLCFEGTMTPYTFEPSHIAVPFDCIGMVLDDFDADGYSRRAGGLPLRMRDELMANPPERGDVVTVQGHFDDPLASTCTATGPEGFDGVMLDPEFLVLYCREQFVVEEITVVGHRDLAPPWWEQPPPDE